MNAMRRRVLRLESAVGDEPRAFGLLFLPDGVEPGTTEADRLVAEHRERTRCAAAVALSAADAAL